MANHKKLLIPGQRFGCFEVLSEIKKFGRSFSVVRCVHCNRVSSKPNSLLRSSKLANCVCQKKTILPEGARYGKLTVLENLPPEKGLAMAAVRCDCGKVFKTPSSFVKSGRITSCKCAKRTQNGETYINGKTTHLYGIYLSMKHRCNKASDKHFRYYGGRGISVCKEWNASFGAFLTWARANGYADGLSIERIDNDGNYCPENCKWVPRSEQSKNRRNVIRISYHGETRILSEWIRLLNIDKSRYYKLKKRGVPTETIFNLHLATKKHSKPKKEA